MSREMNPQMINHMRHFKTDKINSVQSEAAFTFKASSRGGEEHAIHSI